MQYMCVGASYDGYKSDQSQAAHTQQQLHMDLDFIELEHRQNVMKVMQICGLDMQQAYELYMNSNCSVDAAVNKQFGVMSEPSVEPRNEPPPPQHYEEEEYDDPGMYQDYEEEPDHKYAQFKRFIASGRTFEKKYPVRRSESFIKSFIPKFLKGEEEEPFKKQLDAAVGRTTRIKCMKGSLSEALEWSWKEKFPILVPVFDFLPATKPLLREIFTDQNLVELVFNQQFKVFGVSANEYDLQPQLKPVLNINRDKNSFLVLRVNCMDEIETLGKIQLGASKDELKTRLKKIKSECIQHELEDSQIQRQYQEQLKGNFNYQRPKTIKENIKLREDRKLRKQQEDEFFKACQPREEEVKPAAPKKTEVRAESQGVEKKEEKREELPPQPQIKKKSSEQILKERELKHNSLPRYDSGVQFKIRVPSGQNFIITVSNDQKVQYIFDWIGSHPNDLGFNEPLDRRFDIFMGFGGSETLHGREGEKIGEVFEGSEVLIVREN